MSLVFIATAALLQVLVLPGQLAISLLRIPIANRLERVLYGAAISLFFNHAVVLALVATGNYNRPLLAALFGAEILAAALIWKRDAKFPLWPRTLPSLWWLPVLGVISFYIWGTITHFDTVFSANDDVASWDRWAMELYRGTLPTITKIYPQLIPANWSIVYAGQGTSAVKAFAKAIMPLFSIGLVLTFASLAIRRREAAPLVASALCAFLLLFYLGPEFAFTGYVDIPLAFFAFLAFYPLHAAKPVQSHDAGLAILFACASSLTKQGGLYVLALVLLYWSTRRLPMERRWLGVIVFSLATVAAWYGYKTLQIFRGEELSHIPFLIGDIHAGRTPWQRLAAACRLWISPPVGPYVSLFFAACTGIGLFRRNTRILTAVLIVPFFFIWAFLFSYEIRTASMLFPFLALAAGMLLTPSVTFRSTIFHEAPWYVPAAAAFTALMLLTLGPLHSDKLIASQIAQARRIGDPAVNQKLYENQQAITGGVLTNYWYFQALPELGHRNRFLQCGHPCTASEVTGRIQAMPEVSHLLVQEAFLLPSTASEFPSCPALRTVFQVGSVRLYKVDRTQLATCVSGKPR